MCCRDHNFPFCLSVSIVRFIQMSVGTLVALHVSAFMLFVPKQNFT